MFRIYSISIRYVVPDVSPVGIETSFESICRGSTNDFGGKAVPVVHYSHGEGRPPDSACSWKLPYLEWVTSCNTMSDQSEVAFWIHVNTTVEHLVRLDHVTTSASVVE